MFFRFWFLILPKVVALLFLIAVTGMIFGGWLGLVAHYSAYLLFAVGLWGAVLAIYLLFIQGQMNCPVCGACGDFVQFDKKPALDCRRCGLVYVRNLFVDWDVTVEPLSDDGSDQGGS